MNSHTTGIHTLSIRKIILFPAVLFLVLLLLSLVPDAAHTAHAKVRLNKTSLDMVKGMTFQLKLKGTSANVKWKSGKKKIASVNAEGLVTAKKPGKVKITARSGGKKYTCTVTVYNAPNVNTEGALHGIDVSVYQGKINFKKVKNDGISFVIMRAGHGDSADTRFAYNYKNARKNGLKVGCYWFITATSQEALKRQAQKCLNTIKGKEFDLPVFVDIESYSQFNRGKDFCSALVSNFSEMVKEAGYDQGWYTSASFVNKYLSDKVISGSGYMSWVAQHNRRLSYNAPCDIWQYSHTGRVKGISTYVDLNWYFPEAFN